MFGTLEWMALHSVSALLRWIASLLLASTVGFATTFHHSFFEVATLTGILFLLEIATVTLVLILLEVVIMSLNSVMALFQKVPVFLLWFVLVEGEFKWTSFSFWFFWFWISTKSGETRSHLFFLLVSDSSVGCSIWNTTLLVTFESGESLFPLISLRLCRIAQTKFLRSFLPLLFFDLYRGKNLIWI